MSNKTSESKSHHQNRKEANKAENNINNIKKRMEKISKLTEAIIDEVVEGVAIAIVSKLVTRSRKLLETL